MTRQNQMTYSRRAKSPASVPERVCVNQKAPGANFCLRCKCEQPTCTAPRNAKAAACQRRWCLAHGKELSAKLPARSRAAYVTCAGIQRIASTWSSVITLVARWSFLFNLVVPDDMVALADLARVGLVATPGGIITPIQLAMLFIGHAAKWPPLVRAMHTLPAYTVAQGGTRESVVELMFAMARFSSGKSWPKMFANMQSGYMHVSTGLAAQWCHIGLLSNSPSPPTRKKRKRTVEASERFCLGPAGKLYESRVHAQEQ